MPFIDLNALQTSGTGSSAAPVASATPVADTNSAVTAVDPNSVPVVDVENSADLPTLSSETALAAEALPALSEPMISAPIEAPVPEAQPMMAEAPVMAAVDNTPEGIFEPEIVSAPADLAGTVVFDNQPVTEMPAALPEPVVETPPPPIEQPIVEMTAAPITAQATDTQIPTEIPVVAEAPALEVVPEVSPVLDMSTAEPVVDGVLEFTSTPDAEDMDKPVVVKSPEIKVSEGVEIKAEQGGIREVVGPRFDDVPQPALSEITDKTIEQKLAGLGNMMTEGSTAPDVVETPAAPVAVSETIAEAPSLDMGVPSLPTPVLDLTAPVAAAATISAAASALPSLTDMSTMPSPEPLPTPMAVEPTPVAMPDPILQINPITSAAQTLASSTEEVPYMETETSNDPLNLPAKTYGLNEMLVDAIAMRASDLHLSVGYRAMARVDGKLTPIKSGLLDDNAIKAMVAQVLEGREGATVDSVKDYDLSYKLPDGSARFRVNIFRQQESLAMVLRLIPTKIQSIESLKLPAVIKEFTKYSSGLVLFTGPTGSGKSTTIASLLNDINMNEPKHIITVEDPIEYVYPKGTALVDQREIFTDTEGWGDALRSVLRQDPDVVLIGEMRDLETISSAIRVAETGHLVFATLHTNSAAQSVDRIIDVFAEGQQSQIRTQLASVLQAIVSQRLVPISGGGRRVAVEILIATPAVRNAIRDDKVYQIDNMIQTSAELGMISMEKSLVALVREGTISTEQAQAYSNKPADVLTLLGQNR